MITLIRKDNLAVAFGINIEVSVPPEPLNIPEQEAEMNRMAREAELQAYITLLSLLDDDSDWIVRGVSQEELKRALQKTG